VSDPGIALRIGSLTIRWYGIAITTGILSGYLVAYYRAKRRGQNPEHLTNILLFGVAAALIGARLYYVVFSWSNYQNNLKEIFAIWHGGLAIHGGIIGGIIALIIYCRYQKINFWYWADLVAPSLILGQAIGRWGNYANQEAFGYPTKLPWAIYIQPNHRPPEYAGFSYFHPTFLYESIWDIVGFVFLLWLASRQLRDKESLPPGSIFLAYGIYYSIGRFAIESLRTDSLYFGSLRMAQVISVVIIIASLGIYWSFRQRERKKGAPRR
jgi:phosphatidylglycerol:prolipoprotein diacylglycerol transferase